MAKSKPVTEVDPRFDIYVKLLCARVASGKPLFGQDEDKNIFIKSAEEAADIILRTGQSRQWIPGPDDITLKSDQALDVCRRLKALAVQSQGQPDVDKDKLVELFQDVCVIV